MSSLPPGPDRSGEIIAGKYRLMSRLGVGGMAEVWSATNRFTERQVAIKLLAREIAGQPDATARFLNEAKVSGRVDHPNIVEILDVGQADDGQLFLVMELLTGNTLETVLRWQRPPLTTRELVDIMIDVASALAAAHDAGIVHRDLKPSNIYLHQGKTGGKPKVLDFGVSKFRAAGETVEEQSTTMAGTVLGSPLYMSPEQARGETEVDGRSDIFAFGGILFEGLTGFRAYEAKNFNALIVKIATSSPKSIDEHAPAVPESLRKVVRACLEPNLARRAATFKDVLALLRAARPDLKQAPPVPPSEPNVLPERTAYEAALAPRESSRPSPWIPITCGVVVIAAMAVYSLRSSIRDTAVPTSAPSHAPSHAPSSVIAEAPQPDFTIFASPRACVITIDGVDHGSTPVSAKLAPGDHAVTCRPSSGPVRSANVTIGPEAPARYRFLVED